jgi:hypothetical protein
VGGPRGGRDQLDAGAKPAGLETTAAGELALEQPQGVGPATARAAEKAPHAAVGPAKMGKGDDKGGGVVGAGKATVAVLASGRISPAARKRETEREGKSSIAVRMEEN